MSKVRCSRLRKIPEAELLWIEKHREFFSSFGKGDKCFEQTDQLTYAQALVETGLKDAAVPELTDCYERPLAYPFLFVDVYPSFRALSNHKSYEALRARYSTAQ